MRRFSFVLFLAAALCAPLMAQGIGQDDRGNGVDEFAIKDQNFFPGPAATLLGASIDYSGDITGGPLWDRPFADGSCCSGLGPVAYEVQPFFVGSTGSYNVRSVQDGWDGYLFVYRDSFDPMDQTTNFVAGDDDGNGGVGTSDIEGITLEEGVQYYAVQTAFAAADMGPYTNTIEGPGPISLGLVPVIPTLGEWGMIAFVMMLVAAGVVMMRRQKATA